MIKAFGSWVIDTNVPFIVVDSVYTNPLLETIREVGPDVRAPAYELLDVYLPAKEIGQWISEFAPKWKDRGVTIIYDGWSSMTRLNLINFLIYSNGFTVFHKSVNASDVQRKDADYLFKLMKKVVEEVDQQPQDMQGSDCESEGHLSPSSSHGGSGGGGDGGNGDANEIGASYSSRPSTDYFTDRDRGVTVEDNRRSRRSPDEQPREPTQTYRRVRKGKELVQPHGYPTDAMYGYAGFQEVPSNFTGLGLFAPSGGYDTYGGVLNNYGYSSTNTNCPPPPYPSHEPQFIGSDSSRQHRDNPPIINQGTINYGDHHSHQPTFYSGNSTSSE
ncbi:hypothetical protein Cgig2_012090 [Carnegiea gigantea]|uniref:DUF659 domain-containing protein n=1 Tax=Carnegiea gigantea TaxID=171969 RepID=A0A9Q1JGK2_9CARY|nr:hypothetical protein Cgig2_012090 [Carnegiea gigantea]